MLFLLAEILNFQGSTHQYGVGSFSNLSCWLDDEGYHKESLEMAEQGLEFCIKYGNLFFFPILVANKGVALAGLGKMEEAKEQLHQAIMIFKSMKQNDHIQLIIDWCRTNYGIEF